MKSFTALLLLFASNVVTAQPSVETFVRHPAFDDMKISPGGTYLAYTHQEGDEEFLIVSRVSDFEVVSRVGLGWDSDIKNFDWASDDRILFQPGRSFGGQLDYKRSTGEILGVDADGDNYTILFGYQAGSGRLPTGSRITGREPIEAAGAIVDWMPNDPDRVIVQSVGYGIDGEFNLAWFMDVHSGRLRTLARSPIPNGYFRADRNHEMRFVLGANQDNVLELYRRIDEDDWELLVTDDDEARWVQPMAPHGDDGRWLVTDLGPAQTWGLSIWSPDTGEKESLFHHPDADVSVIYFNDEWQLWGVEYEIHFPEMFFPDESHPLAVLHRQLRERFGSSVNVRIIDETTDLSRVIVYISGPQNPGEYLLVDAATQEFLLRMPRYPDLPVETLTRMEPIELTVRDGMTIRGYLSVPLDADRERLPMVVFVHGGPHGIADAWDYNYETQLLTSRGYAVLQVNFRGSGGRGQAFLEAGHGEWGGKMQDDVTDATHWAVEQGIADPERICIYGASYGAYAALTGAFREPELYQCAIGMSGVYDLNLMFERGDIADAERGLSYVREALGEDSALLASRSPAANAGAIRANVMLIHGRLDNRAPIEQAERMRDALEEAGKDVVWLTEVGEAHGIMSDANRVRVYEDMLAFLAENIGE